MVSATGSATAEIDAVASAFALGWQISRLYSAPLASTVTDHAGGDLPGLSSLAGSPRVTLGLAQADGGIRKLEAFLGDRTTLPTTTAARSAIAARPPDREAAAQAVLDLHVTLLIALSAADFRLGKAYGLGRALGDTCASASGSEIERRSLLEHRLNPYRGGQMIGWLEDLTSVLPTHAGHAVADSLRRWIDWASGLKVSDLSQDMVDDITHELYLGGQRWRAVLSGEKQARDFLQIGVT